jgi:hypothetical protein
VLVVGVVGFWLHEHGEPGPASSGCAHFVNVVVDLAPSSGLPTQAEALHAFLTTRAAAQLPRSGYTTPSEADLRAAVAAGERGSDVTPSVSMPTFWHTSHGKVDVEVQMSRAERGWAVTGVSACG